MDWKTTIHVVIQAQSTYEEYIKKIYRVEEDELQDLNLDLTDIQSIQDLFGLFMPLFKCLQLYNRRNSTQKWFLLITIDEWLYSLSHKEFCHHELP